MMLPNDRSVGFGGFAVGQVISRTGRTPIFPSLGIDDRGAYAALLRLFRAGDEGHLQFAWFLGVLSVFLGHGDGGGSGDRGAAEAGKRMLAPPPPLSRWPAHSGRHWGTAIVGRCCLPPWARRVIANFRPRWKRCCKERDGAVGHRCGDGGEIREAVSHPDSAVCS